MKHSLSYNFYVKMLKFYLSIFLIISALLAIILIFDIDLWIVYLLVILLFFLCMSPFFIVMLKKIHDVKKAEEWPVYEGKIIKLIPEFSMTVKSYLKAIVEIEDEGKFNIETYPVLDPKALQELKNKEIQVAYKKGEKAYIMMIL